MKPTHATAALVLVVGCSASSPTTGVGDGGSGDGGSGVDAVATADTGTTADAPMADLSTADLPLADVPVGDSAAGVPAGYTLTPFLSDAPMYDFPEADQVLVAGRDYAALVETDVGRMVIDLYEQQTPVTVNSFVFLARHHFFDGIAFHRVIEGFVAQGGDPNTLMDDRTMWGTGGPGYHFGLEIVPGLQFDGPGVVGMARASSPDSNGSQFYITLAATPSLNGMYTVFARVTQGMDVLARLARGEPPTTPSRMTRVSIIERPR